MDLENQQLINIGNAVTTLRLARNMTKKELAGRVGITPKQISRIEKGTYGASLLTLRSIAQAFGTSLKSITCTSSEYQSTIDTSTTEHIT